MFKSDILGGELYGFVGDLLELWEVLVSWVEVLLEMVELGVELWVL